MAEAFHLSRWFSWASSHSVHYPEHILVRRAGREVRRIRAEALTKMKGGLRALYRTLELPGANPLKDAHAAAVLAAYRFDAKKDLLTQLLALNLEVAKRIEAGQPVTAPGVPRSYPEAKRLISHDCIIAGDQPHNIL